MFTCVFVTLSILQSQFIEKAENSEQNVVLLLFLYTLDSVILFCEHPLILPQRQADPIEEESGGGAREREGREREGGREGERGRERGRERGYNSG